MLRIQVLGGFHAHVTGGDVSVVERQPRRAALLAYLALERDAPRSRVIAMFWPGAPPERGRHSLNQGIYHLRRVIGSDWIEATGERCVVAPTVTTDVEALERAAATNDHAEVIRLYQGTLLAGLTQSPGVEFDMWLDRRRATVDRLHRIARRRILAALIAEGRQRDALHCAAEWCRLDPMEDEAQHRYMELLAAAGRRADALRQFHHYRRMLEEHDLQPLDETLALVERLQHGEAGPFDDADATAAGTVAVAGTPTAPAAAGGAPVSTAAAGATAAAAAAATHAGATAHSGVSAGAQARAAPAPATSRTPWLLATHRGLGAVLALVFLFNLVETTVETWLAPGVAGLAGLRFRFAQAAHAFEGFLSFEYHELTSRIAVVGYSVSYFFIFALLLAATGIMLARRPDVRPFRVFSLAIAFNYLISLPFFLFVPVPERWSHPPASATLLSDLWSPRLIEVFRPISGLDNSFPSFHVSLTTLVVLACFLFRVRFRWSALLLGCTVVLATFALGIHWITDIVAGIAAGIISIALAARADRKLAARERHAPTTSHDTVPAATPALAGAAGGVDTP